MSSDSTSTIGLVSSVVAVSWGFIVKNEKLSTPAAWQNYFQEIGLPQGLVEAYSGYASRLLKSGLPVIFEIRHLSLLLGVSEGFLNSIHNASKYHYRNFSIKKRGGGQREIEAPRSALKKCQNWVLKEVIEKIRSHDAATGFRKGCSVVKHAARHVGNSSTLKMDFKDFFPSIKKRRIVALFEYLGYSKSVSLYLASICCLGDRLPQGAPTSPSLSNIVARKFDARVTALANKRGWRYSRYADDIAITGHDVRFSLSKLIAAIAKNEGFEINDSKSRLMRPGSRRIITGVAIRNSSLTLPRPYRRELVQEVHYISKYGVFSHASKTKQRDPLLLERIKGKLAFWLQVEPRSKVALSLLEKLQKATTFWDSRNQIY